ncbi:MAG: AMP-binding protein, partial [Actinobacteria bacterium]|nr:AMP-binding protein [Actinomycetota bacterium]
MSVSDGRALWSPPKEDLRGRPFQDLKKLIPSETPSETYGEVHQWSVSAPGEFWTAVWDEQGIIGEQGAVAFDAGSDFISSQFFPLGSLNVTENLFRNGRANAVAIVAIDEDGTRREVTWQELARQVAAVASALKSVGVEKGDRIVAWVPNTLEPIIFALAGLSI